LLCHRVLAPLSVRNADGASVGEADARGTRDVVPGAAVERAGLSNLNEGAKVSYEVVANRGKESAENLRVG